MSKECDGCRDFYSGLVNFHDCYCEEQIRHKPHPIIGESFLNWHKDPWIQQWLVTWFPDPPKKQKPKG